MLFHLGFGLKPNPKPALASGFGYESKSETSLGFGFEAKSEVFGQLYNIMLGMGRDKSTFDFVDNNYVDLIGQYPPISW